MQQAPRLPHGDSRVGLDVEIAAGESGVAGLAGLLVALGDEALKHAIGLDANSSILPALTDSIMTFEFSGEHPIISTSGRTLLR